MSLKTDKRYCEDLGRYRGLREIKLPGAYFRENTVLHKGNFF